MTDALLKIELNGLQAVKQMLEKLPEKTRRKVSKKALKKSGEIVADRARQLCPVASGALKASIKTRVSVGSRSEKSVISAGDNTAFYANMVEYGFRHTGHGKRGQRKMTSRGVVEGKAFMRNAMDQMFDKTIDVFSETVAEVVQEEMDSVAKTPGGE